MASSDFCAGVMYSHMGTERDWATLFDLETSEVETVLDQFVDDTFEGRPYRHLSDTRHGVERGTAIVQETVIRGFPSIPRTLVLDPGIPEFFEERVTIEEKRNGYNVRVARIEGDVLAFTRGGYICPYTTGLVRDTFDPGGFFDDHPELMVCGELIGPENPYTPHDYESVASARLEVFDIRQRESGAPLPVEHRRDHCRAYDLPQVPSFGEYDPEDAPEQIRQVIENLNREGREGVVMKSPDGRRLLKYTTSATHRADLEHAFSLPFDYGQEFMFPRILREIFQAVEFDERGDTLQHRAHDLGEAILLPAVDTVRAVRRGETVGEDHTVRGDPDDVEALLSHLRDLGLKLDIESDRLVDGERVVTFVKISQATQDNTQNYLEGQIIDE